MKTALLAALVVVVSLSSHAQPSGIYNGDFTEHCPNAIGLSACGFGGFDCVYNWYNAGGNPGYNNNTFTMRAGINMFNEYSNMGINGGYIFEPGKTYVIDFRFKLTSTAAHSSIRFFAYASIQRHFYPFNSSSCGIDKFAPDPSNDLPIGSFETFNSLDWTDYEMTFTCPSSGYWYIWVFPEWNSTAQGNVVMELDYVRVRQCGTGVLNISNQVLPEPVYAKETINLGENIVFPSLHRQFIGQEITMLPGFSTPAAYTGDGIEMTAVSTCLLPVQPAVVGRPAGAEGNEALQSPDRSASSEIKVYPSPADDYIDVRFSGLKSEEVDLAIVNVTGQVISRSTKRFANFSGTRVERLSTGNLPAGSYLLKVNNGMLNQTVKFTVVH